jgi:DNA-binding transcriptional LysR family regulator
MDSLSRIPIFLEVARQQSFVGAARDLGLTPSAVSKQVQNLEEELGAKLLNRTTRRVSLTEEGALFYERASRALDDLVEAREALNELKSTPRGGLRVSVPAALCRQLKTPIAAFAARYPEVQMDVQFDDRLIDLTEDGFDVVLRIGALPDSSLVARRLAPCPVYPCCSPSYLARHGTPGNPEELARHPVVAYTRNRGVHEWRYQAPDGTQGVVALRGGFKCDSAEMMIESACHGLGIIIMPWFFVREELEAGRLVRVLPEYRTMPERNLHAVFPPNRFLSTRLRLFVDAMRDHCRATFGE